MRMLNRNKQRLYYALQTGTRPIYETDSNGDIVYIEVDGEMIPVETGEKETTYSEPVAFYSNIAMSGGDSKEVEYGISTADYEAVIVTSKNYIPLDETSLIWHHTQPQRYSDGSVNPKSADYTVIKINESLNDVRYVLKEVVK